MNAATARSERAELTRQRILAAAERLFAEQGVFAVSNRQISDSAGQGNNAAVGYHFGTKADLLLAIVRKHTEPVERRRAEMLEGLDADSVRDWVSCLVRPATDYHASLRDSTLARFTTQLMTDPALRPLVVEETLAQPTLQRIMDGLNACLPDLPLPAKVARNDMTRHLMVHMCAEQERAIAEGAARLSWQQTADQLVDALTGLWLAPVA